MKIPKAIERLSIIDAAVTINVSPEFKEATKLGIEALERHQVRASLTYADMMKPLPGETKE